MNVARLFTHFDRLADAPDAIPRLRRFILDLAVRGKLVPQDPNDEPASELLKRIATEKRRMVEAGEIRKPKMIIPLNETEIPFMLPANWRWSQIAEIGLLSLRNEATDDTLASFVPMPMIAADYGEASNHEVRRWGDIEKGYTHFAEGDVGLAKITPCFQNGKSTVFRDLTGGLGSGTTELHIVRPLFGNPNFILIFLKCPNFIETGIPRMTGTAGQKRVPAEYFAYSPFPLPPLAEQHRIVAKVDELMAMCDRLEATRAEREETRNRMATASLARLNAPDPNPATFQNHATFALDNLSPLTTRPDQIKALRQTILNLAVRGKLVPQNPNDEPASELLKRIAKDFLRQVAEGKLNKPKPVKPLSAKEELFSLPRGWALARFNQVAAIQSNLVDPKRYAALPHIAPDNIESWTTRLLSYESVGEAGVYSGKHLFSAEAILYSKIRPNLAKVAKVDFDGLCSADMYPIHALIDRDFLVKFMITKDFVAQAVKEDNRVAMPKINQSALSDIVVPVPPLAEQHHIVAKVDELMALCARLEASLTTGDETRGRLVESTLHEALTQNGPC